MRLTTILNRVEKYKSFVSGTGTWEQKKSGGSEEVSLVFPLRPRKGARAICSGCGAKCRMYDRAKEPRRFEYVPL